MVGTGVMPLQCPDECTKDSYPNPAIVASATSSNSQRRTNSAVLQDTHDCHNLTIMLRTISIYLCTLLEDVNKSSITTVTIPTHKTSIYCFLDLFRKRSRQQGQRASLCTPKVMSMIRYVLHHDAELTCAFTCYTNRCHRAMPRCSALDEYSVVICTLAVIYNGQNLPTYQNPERSSSRAYKVWVSPFLARMT
ncbi:hypothetical protein HBI26_087430 [Parastagonospora nodorum]|nr:hypothetical protein HBI26_087430 [Parastagonospora nodorum]